MDEKLRILKMLEDGIINANEASELLDALKVPDTAPRTGRHTDCILPCRNRKTIRETHAPNSGRRERGRK